MIGKSFWLKENLVRGAVREAHHLVLDRGAVAGAPALDRTRINGRAREVAANEVVAFRPRGGDVAAHLRPRDHTGKEGEGLGRLVALLRFQRGPVDGAAVEPWRGAGLQPAEAEAQPLKGERKARRRRVADTARRDLPLPDMDEAAQEMCRW